LIKYLGHASIYIEVGQTSIVTDPWFSKTGAFLASWHQFPENEDLDLDLVRDVDYVVLSHEHLDHFDIDFLKTINPNTKILIPTYKDKYLLNILLKELKNKVIEVDYKTKYTFCANFTALPLNQTVPIQMDCTWIFETPEGVVVDVNDMAPTKDDIEWMRSNYDIKYLFHQFSGANWYPHIYHYDSEKKVKLSKSKISNKFHHCLSNFKALNAKYLVPSAGPPCFLDDELFDMNFSESSTFPTSDIFYEYCIKEGVAKDSIILCLPNDTIEDNHDNTKLLKHRAYSDKLNYLKEYKERRQGVIDEYKKSINHHSVNDNNLLERFKQSLEPLVESSRFFRNQIGGKVLFQIDKKYNFLINFLKRRNSVSEWSGEEEYMYRYEISLTYLNMILEKKLRWEELFLSCRFKAFRDPDVHNQALQTFLYYDGHQAKDMYKYYEDYYTKRKLEETFQLSDNGKKYECQRYCPHAMADLSKGQVINGELICPNHGWAFKLKDGSCERHNSKIKCEELIEVN
tara:strand:- start:584 stop:2125 length:1542 start_codon:yes stop_codon:yes gene_type:complete